MSLLYFLLIGAVSGWLAGKIIRGSGFGLIGDIVVGIIGGMVGGWLFGELGISHSNTLLGALVTSVVGAVVLIWLVGLIFGRK